MTITADYVREKFDALNALCFDGGLAPLPVSISRARTFLGSVRYKRRRKHLIFGGWKYSDFRLVISKKVELLENERDVEDVILHEMIHYAILSRQQHDTSAHGRLFREMMDDINTRFNRHITISHRTTEDERQSDTERRQHLVCVTRFRDGSCGITLAARTRFFALWDTLPTLPGAVDCTWYVSTSPYFNRFPRSRTPKAYRADAAELAPHLATAKRLVRNGRTIGVALAPNV